MALFPISSNFRGDFVLNSRFGVERDQAARAEPPPH